MLPLADEVAPPPLYEIAGKEGMKDGFGASAVAIDSFPLTPIDDDDAAVAPTPPPVPAALDESADVEPIPNI